jgi:Xaa-Pro aminopeptidase
MHGLKALVIGLLFVLVCTAIAQENATRQRRQRAMAEFRDGILLLHASSRIDATSDGFRQDPFFYYFTGLENVVSAVLAIDGKSRESWLFLPSNPPFSRRGAPAEVSPDAEAEKRLGIEHVVDWKELQQFLSSRAAQNATLYFADDGTVFDQLPANLLKADSPKAPGWLQVILQRWPALRANDGGPRVQVLMEVQDASEAKALRQAARSTVTALMTGMRAIGPGVSQRSVESVVEDSCWKQGAHGGAFWPWTFAGENAVFPRPFFSLTRYDHLNRTMQLGELVRLDVGCEWDHYQGDLGRTVPVSGHYTHEQRETWEIFVAAYRAGVKALRDGVAVDQVFDAWRAELVKHRSEAKSSLAQHAIDSWSDRKNVPFWQIHTTNLTAGFPSGGLLKTGMTINFEPIASVDGQGFFLEDMYVVTKDGAELLTPGVPYSADEIEKAMAQAKEPPNLGIVAP